jgi:hypothetical protein
MATEHTKALPIRLQFAGGVSIPHLHVRQARTGVICRTTSMSGGGDGMKGASEV